MEKKQSEWESSGDGESCALICNIRKGAPSHGNIKRTLQALERMGHRSGIVGGEGDGCGVMIDIPRRLWKRYLAQASLNTAWADNPRFFVAHFFLPHTEKLQAQKWLAHLRYIFVAAGARILVERRGRTRSEVLGPNARRVEPEFWQVAALFEQDVSEREVDRALFELQLRVEGETPLYPVSISRHIAVYKVYGGPSTIAQYYPELSDPECLSRVTIGHCRYSTNTCSTFERAQPFMLLGHNGEINTIGKLRHEGRMLGIQLPPNGSDSQDLDRVLHHLVVVYGFSLAEAMEIVFPPVLEELEWLPEELQAMYRYYRAAFGPFAQGPAALVSRYREECLFSVDALGLRPLWFAETEKELVFTSERGVLPFDTLVRQPRPLAPGEKIAVYLHDDWSADVVPYWELQWQVYYRWQEHVEASAWLQEISHGEPGHRKQKGRRDSSAWVRVALDGGTEDPDGAGKENPGPDGFGPQFSPLPAHPVLFRERRRKADLLGTFGWGEDDLHYVEAVASAGEEPIGALGYDAPLAALAPEGHNLADYFKEIVAVVTNPSMDRERETEHFNTQTLLGHRPPLEPEEIGAFLPAAILELETPLLIDATYLEQAGLLPRSLAEEVAAEEHAWTLEAVMNHFEGVPTREEWAGNGLVRRLSLTYPASTTVREALRALCEAAIQAVQAGALLLLLDDGDAFTGDNLFLDPHLAVAAVDRALRETWLEVGSDNGREPLSSCNLRRRCGIILRSGALRNLHDLILALSWGADALVPYLLYDVALSGEHPEARGNEAVCAQCLRHLLRGLTKGLEKVIATMGTHELRGYGRNYASIGVAPEIADLVGCRNFCGEFPAAFDYECWDAEIRRRWQRFIQHPKRTSNSSPIRRDFHFTPLIAKAAQRVAMGETPYHEYEERVKGLEQEHPIALRHLLDIRFLDDPAQWKTPDQVDLSVGWHDLPFVISSMSFGSQNEVVYRAYAEAAYQLNMLALSGEGGELADLIGRYPFNRGQQIASGRFGVNAYYCNSSYWLEIKIGQGAKPGEGGHLPGRKVTNKVAAVRCTVPGVGLISPNNNHDLYSIEDLAQLISELKTINPRARVIVKVPVVANIGVIAVGIVKAGADVLNLSGFDGGTGAARLHAIQHVGLPAEIGIKEAHRSLVEAGVRNRVELWADGGMRSARDVLRCILLGANRVGFGTLAMIAVGCTVCRRCHLGTCPVGIATQVERPEEAALYGLKRFEPRDFDRAVGNLVNFFSGMGEELRRLTGMLGADRLQDLVGRCDLLTQPREHDPIVLRELLQPVLAGDDRRDGVRRLYRPLGYTTRLISQIILEEVEPNNQCIIYEDSHLGAADRAIGTYLAGAMVRAQIGLPALKGPAEIRPPALRELENVELSLSQTIAGNGLGAFHVPQITIRVVGGAQDGVAKSACGGQIVILKGINHKGHWLDGSVGKGFAYGAQRGFFAVQGYADSRACVRLSGADVVFGSEITEPLDDSQGLINIAARANLKGFAFEYMTAGRVVVMGDPGPWICAGMTGGVIYVRLSPEMNFDENALRRRFARSARVRILPVDAGDVQSIGELLSRYAVELERNNQWEEAQRVRLTMAEAGHRFVKIVPDTSIPEEAGSGE
mgnify:CR=1 FL=1